MMRIKLMQVCAPALAAACALAPGAQARQAVAARARPALCLPAHDGYLRARLRGASDLDIDWHDRRMQCDGDVRPDGHAIRLTFAGRVSGHHRVRFVFGIDAAPLAGVTHNVAAGVTVIFEGERRLYSTRGPGKCTVDDLRQQPVGAAAAHTLRVSARGFCIGAAGRVGSSGDALLLTTFDFAGRISNPAPPPDR